MKTKHIKYYIGRVNGSLQVRTMDWFDNMKDEGHKVKILRKATEKERINGL